MTPPSPPPPTDTHAERLHALHQLEEWLERPMLALSLVWLALLVLEMTRGPSPLREALAAVAWVVFLLDFALRLALAPRRLAYLRANWLTFATFGYVTATLATYFVGRDAEAPDAELAGQASVDARTGEVWALREEVGALAARLDAGAGPPAG